MPRRLDLIILGLDGATFDIINPMIAQGRLPNLARLQREGSWGPLRSTLPPVTAAAWSTFMTGMNPAGHGIFQWRTYDPTKYTHLDERVVTASRLAGRTFWDILGDQGRRVAVLTVPVTYPPWPVNGYMLSGYPCPDTRANHGHPAAWAATLAERYNFSADHYLRATDEQILGDGLEMLRRRTDLALALADTGEIDTCVVVLGEIDRAQHDFFKYSDVRFSAARTAPDPLRKAIERHYEVADEQVGCLWEALAPAGTMLVISDHGGAAHPDRYFHTNAWLNVHGWLVADTARSSTLSGWLRGGIQAVRRRLPFEDALRRKLPHGLVDRTRSFTLNIADIAWDRTRAYRFPMYAPSEGIEVNLRGRQPAGTVHPGAEYERLVEEVIEALRDARDPETGSPIVREVHAKEDIYRGPYLDIAPDIVFVTYRTHRTGIDCRGPYTSVVDLDALVKDNGTHTMDGILLACGEGIAKGRQIRGAELVDIAPTILRLAGAPIPQAMDGKVLADILEGDLPAQAVATIRAGAQAREEAGLTAEEEEDMLNKLRGLGYVE